MQNEMYEKIDKAINNAVRKVEQLIEKMGDKFPTETTFDNRYKQRENDEWTMGFFTGLILLSYEYTRDEKFSKKALEHVKDFDNRIINEVGLHTHDLGFLYELSCVKYDMIFGSDYAKGVALQAAEHLIKRFHPKAGIIQAWGDLDDPINRGRMIIDCNMNLPLLMYATKNTNDLKYSKVALAHLEQAQKYLIRDDFSSFHTYYFSPETGEALRGSTAQGYGDDSCWARGQAWAVYGFAKGYGYTKDKKYLETSINCAKYFIERLPENDICYWDLVFTDSDELKDSSAAAIFINGLFELSKYVDETMKNNYIDLAMKLLNILIDNYSVKQDEADGLLMHAVYHVPDNRGVDECCTWGDYYYFEALMKAKKYLEMNR